MHDLIKIFSFPVTVLVVYIVLAYGLDIYTIYPWFDIPFHVTGGVSFGYTGVVFLRVMQQRKQVKSIRPVLIWFIATAFVAFVAIAWEMQEFIMQLFFPPERPMTLDDTMFDLLVGIIGGTSSAGYFSWRYRI